MTFEQYATSRLPVLLATARAICGEPALAEDLVQDVLIKLHARWTVIEAVEQRDAYVRRMLVNEFVSWRRKWARISLPGWLPSPRQGGENPAVDAANAHADRAELMAEIRRLPPRQRVVIGLRYYADQSDAQIAEALGCSPATVRVHAARALATLRINVEQLHTKVSR